MRFGSNCWFFYLVFRAAGLVPCCFFCVSGCEHDAIIGCRCRVKTADRGCLTAEV